MTNEQAYVLMERYGKDAEKLEKVSRSDTCQESMERLQIMVMLAHPTIFDDGKMNRWLGFMQGVMYAFGAYTLEQLKQHIKEVKNEDQGNGQETASQDSQRSVLEVSSI